MPEIVVSFTVSGQRQKYLRKALDSWKKVRGIGAVQVVFCCEPAPSFPVAEFAAWAGTAFPGAVVLPNPTVFGIVKNTMQAFDVAFHLGATLGVMAEEDLVVSADIVDYLAWAAHTYQEDQQVAAVCSHVKSSESRDPAAAVRVPWFNPLVCGTWKDRWEKVWKPGWRNWEEGVPDNTAWDNNLRNVLGSAAKVSIFPTVSRVLHIGELSTTYGPALSDFMYKDSVSSCFAPDWAAPVSREVAFDTVPGLVV